MIFAINNIKEEGKTKQEHAGNRGENSGHGEKYGSVYELKPKLLINEVSKHKIILLNTRCTRENLEQSLVLDIIDPNAVLRITIAPNKINSEASTRDKNTANALIIRYQICVHKITWIIGSWDFLRKSVKKQKTIK